MQPRLEFLHEKILVGKRTKMSFSLNKTQELWRSFMPRRKEIIHSIGLELYSVEIYPPDFFQNFNPEVEFEKWAAIPVSDFKSIPDEMEGLRLPEGLYAVFIYTGLPEAASQTYRYIFETWLPKSDFLLDNRPHLAVMGSKYKHNDPDSEEELWIPVMRKNK